MLQLENEGGHQQEHDKTKPTGMIMVLKAHQGDEERAAVVTTEADRELGCGRLPNN